MHSTHVSPLPNILSAATLGLLAALLLSLFDATRSRNEYRQAPLAALITPNRDSIAGWRTREPTAARLVFESQLDALAISLDTLAAAIDHESPGATHRAFRNARLAYKRSESLLQLYSPTIAHDLNGPLENDDGDAPPKPLGSPAAFQTILSALAPDGHRETRTAAHALALSMHDEVVHLRGQTRYLDVAELPVLEGARAEIARTTTLGLAGVDLDDPSNAVSEAAASLDGVRAITDAEASAPTGSVSRTAWLRISQSLARASSYLRAHRDFEQLDRLELITAYANPAAAAIAAARAPLLAHARTTRRVWRAEAATVFEPRALDPAAFAPDYAPAATPALIALGARLFADTRLSGNGDRSCATCHQPQHAFTDGRARPLLIAAGRPPSRISSHFASRNTPTLLEVAYQPLYFADERARSLEDQIGMVLASPSEMGSSADIAAAHLVRDSTLRAQFARAFASRSDVAPTGRTVRVALAAYLRSLGTFDSRFDRAVRGDAAVLAPRERVGFTLFMGKARCGTCHFAPLFSGVMPPEFTTSEPEIIGVATRAVRSRATIDPDWGRAGVDHIAEHLFAFKVPTLRNIARTAPYMHNGAYATLDDVIEFYEHGGGAGLGAHIAYSTLPPTRLHLTTAERGAIIAFLRTLSDEAPPVRAGAPMQPKAIAAR